MQFEIFADEIRGIVVARMRGNYEPVPMVRMVTRARELSMQRGWNILYDMSAAEPGGVTRGEVFWFPRRLPALQSEQARQRRVALLHPPQFSALAHFWETSFRNAGLQACAFAEEAMALEWLGAK